MRAGAWRPSFPTEGGTESGAELLDDCVALITTMAGLWPRHAKRRATQILACVKQCSEQAEQVD